MLLGCVPDAPDSRDLQFAGSPLLSAPPLSGAASFDYRWCDSPRRQAYNSCVGHACAGSAALAMAIAGTPIRFPSPAFTWAGSRLLGMPGQPLADRGCSIRHAFKWLHERGMVTETRWPETVEAVTSIPPLDAWQEGECARVEAYYRIEDGAGSPDAIRAALARGHCPVFAMHVDQRFEQIGRAVYDGYGGKLLGGHAMVFVGYSAALDAFLVRNTWGRSWGDDGYCWIAASFVALSTFDRWVIQVVPEVR